MNKKIMVAVIAVTAVLFAAAAVLSIVLLADKNAALEQLNALDSELNSVNAELDESKKNADELRLKLDETERKLRVSAGDWQSALNAASVENETLESEIKRLEVLLDTRTRDKKKLDGLALITDSIAGLVQKGAPLVRVKLDEEEYEKRLESDPEAADHYFAPSADYTAKLREKYGAVVGYLPLSALIEDSKVTAPHVAVYYLDLLGGYEYSFGGDEVFDAASVMKAPFITAILLEMESSEKDGEPEESALTFDALSETIILDHATMDVRGSGVLKDAPDGGEYTYLELMELAIKNSDNIAFDQIKKRFGSEAYFDFARECGAVSPNGYIMNLTVREAGEMFRRIYLYTQGNGEYSRLLAEWMRDSAHLVLAKSVLGSDKVLHKYGWDINAYHDAAIVLGDRPYIAIVFTDLDCGGAEADGYVRALIAKLRELHEYVCE